MLNRDDRDVY